MDFLTEFLVHLLDIEQRTIGRAITEEEKQALVALDFLRKICPELFVGEKGSISGH